MRTMRLASHLWLLILAIACAAQPDQQVDRPEIPAFPLGTVDWMDPENPSTWENSDSPFFLFTYSRRSHWSWDMAQEVLGDPELARELGRISRPVAIDADLRPDLIDRFGTGSLPGIAVLTPGLDWVTGAGWMGHEDVSDLARRIRILNDIPARMEDLERERARLLRRHPYRRASFALTARPAILLTELIARARNVDVSLRSGEMQLLLSNHAGEDVSEWLDAIVDTSRLRSDGLYRRAVNEEPQVLDEAHLVEANLGWLYVLGRIGQSQSHHREIAAQLAQAIRANVPMDQGLLTSGYSDFGLDSSGVRVGSHPPLWDRRTLTAWNGLYVSGASQVAGATDDSDIAALGAILDTLLSRRISSEGVARVAGDRTTSQLEDAAHLIRAALDFSALSADQAYATRASRLTASVLEGGLPLGAAHPPHTPNQFVHTDSFYGSASGVLAQGLLRLYRITGRADFRDMAETICREAIHTNPERIGRLGAVGRALADLVALEGELN